MDRVKPNHQTNVVGQIALLLSNALLCHDSTAAVQATAEKKAAYQRPLFIGRITNSLRVYIP